MSSSALRILWVGPQGLVPAALQQQGVDVLTVDTGVGSPAAAEGAWRRRRRLHDARPDVVHLEGLAAVHQWAVPARLTGVPAVWHLDQVPPAGTRLPPVRPAALVADSRTALEQLPRVALARVVPVAVDEAPATSFPSYGPVRSLGVVCSGVVSRGEHGFLQAFASAFAAPSRARAVVGLVADDDDQGRRRLWSLAGALGVADRLDLVVQPLRSYLPQLDVFVHLPPRPPTDPSAVVEAMAAGVPVAATRLGADAEVVEHEVTGLLVEPDDTGDLMLQLMRLDLDHRLRSRLAAAGLRRAQDFTASSAARALRQVYREVLS